MKQADQWEAVAKLEQEVEDLRAMHGLSGPEADKGMAIISAGDRTNPLDIELELYQQGILGHRAHPDYVIRALSTERRPSPPLTTVIADTQIAQVSEPFIAHETPKADITAVDRLFSRIERFSLILPTKTRRESFEPSYNDLKADFLQEQDACKDEWARRRLTYWFAFKGTFLTPNCLWVLLCSKVKWCLRFLKLY